MKIAFVSKGPVKVVEDFHPPVRPQVGVRNWPFVLNCTRMGWELDPPKEIKDYNVFMVNVFSRSKQVDHIKLHNPKALVIGMPDPHLERVFQNDFVGIDSQLKYCDIIGARTKAGVRVYQALYPTKKVYWLPSPIGPTKAFEDLHIPYEERQNAILTVDHRTTHNMTIQNVLACKELQDKLAWPVHYYNASDRSVDYASKMGLNVIFNDKVKWQHFVQIAANYKICVDIYPAHSNHRNGQAMAMLKVPLVGCSLPNRTVLQNQGSIFYTIFRGYVNRLPFEDFEFVVDTYGFEASKERLMNILNENI